MNEKKQTDQNLTIKEKTMSKKEKNAVAKTEVKNEATTMTTTTFEQKLEAMGKGLVKGFQEGLAAKIETYIAREDSCAAAMTKVWFGEGLTYDESMAFCVKWNAEHKPGNTWGSKRSHIQAHRNWLRSKYWMNTEVSVGGKIQVVGQYEF